MEQCFQARPLNKKICPAIFVIGRIYYWVHRIKIFSFKSKRPIVARYDYEYMNSLKIPSTTGPKTDNKDQNRGRYPILGA